MTLQHALACRASREPNLQKPLWSGAAWQLMREKMENQVRPYSQQNTCALKLFQANHKPVQKLSTRGMKKKFIMSGCLHSTSITSVKVSAEDKLPAEAHLPLLPRAQASSLPRKPPPIIVTDLTSLEIFSRLLKSSIWKKIYSHFKYPQTGMAAEGILLQFLPLK